MPDYFINPPCSMRNVKSGNGGALCVKGNHLAVWDKTRGARIIARDWVVVDRTAVRGWLVGIIWDLWQEFAPCDGVGGRHHGGVEALKRAEDALRTAGLIESDGAPRQMTAPLGAAGMPQKENES